MYYKEEIKNWPWYYINYGKHCASFFGSDYAVTHNANKLEVMIDIKYTYIESRNAQTS